MPQAVKIETQSEQQGSPNLHGQAAARSPRRELVLDRREEGFDQSAETVQLLRKRPSHFGTHTTHTPSFLPALGGNHTAHFQFLPNVGVIPLAAEFGIGQY